MSNIGRPPVKPSIDDPNAVARLCEYLASGLSMMRACEKADAPSQTSVYIKLAKDAAFREIIARAREAQQAALMDATLDMADEATAEDWQIVRMRIWARQWLASKLAARTYGDKIQHANAVGDGNAEMKMTVTFVRPSDT